MRLSPNRKIKLKNQISTWNIVCICVGFIGIMLGALLRSGFGNLLIAVGVIALFARLGLMIYYKVVDNAIADTSIDDMPHLTPPIFHAEEDFLEKEKKIVTQEILSKAEGYDFCSYEGQFKLLKSFETLISSDGVITKSEPMQRLKAGKTDPKRIIGELLVLTERAIDKIDFNYMLHRWKQTDMETLTDAYLLVDFYLYIIEGNKPTGLTSAKNALVKTIYSKLK